LKKKIITFILIPFLAFAQWNYGNLNNEISTYATGKIHFWEFDDFEFKLIKSKNKDLVLSINSDYFKEDYGYYYVIISVFDKHFRITEFETFNGKFNILELQDLVKNDKYTAIEFLKFLKSDDICIVTIKNDNKIIQGFSSLKESSLAINYVLRR
tara:strand:- start:290 stop:754 length:465 start_codon:yes stop_codon:yes gene_type:complete